MKTFIPTEDFSGYPHGAKEGSKPTFFKKGVESEPVPVAFVDLVIGKKQGREADPKPAPERQEAEAATAAADELAPEDTKRTRSAKRSDA